MIKCISHFVYELIIITICIITIFNDRAKRLPPSKIPGNSSPGPANYGLCSADVYKSKPPEYSMRPALKPKPLQSYNPGPAAYCPNLYVSKSTPPQYTFGTACHKIPLITAEDNYSCEDYDVYVDEDQC